MENNVLIINPKTRVLQLIETYPQLEEVLIAYVPAFAKLRNPILRNTVARITTLQQAAAIGNVKLEDLINHLREQVGQDTAVITASSGYNRLKPDWLDAATITAELDARDLLERGEHPVNQVVADLKKILSDGVYKLTAPFLPAPLIDKASSLGFAHYIKEESAQLFVIYFYQPK